jgi:hypothetical protein
MDSILHFDQGILTLMGNVAVLLTIRALPLYNSFSGLAKVTF